MLSEFVMQFILVRCFCIRYYQFSSRFANANWKQLKTFINQQNEELTVTKSLRNNDLILFDQSKSQLLRQIFLLTFIKNVMQCARRNSFAYAFLERLKWNNFLLKKTSKLQTENLKLQHKLKKERISNAKVFGSGRGRAKLVMLHLDAKKACIA